MLGGWFVPDPSLTVPQCCSHLLVTTRARVVLVPPSSPLPFSLSPFFFFSSQVEAGATSRYLTKEISAGRCSKPPKTALPSWMSGTCARSMPAECWRAPGFSTSIPTTEAGSTCCPRGSTANPWSGERPAPPSSPSAASPSEAAQ